MLQAPGAVSLRARGMLMLPRARDRGTFFRWSGANMDQRAGREPIVAQGPLFPEPAHVRGSRS